MERTSYIQTTAYAAVKAHSTTAAAISSGRGREVHQEANEKLRGELAIPPTDYDRLRHRVNNRRKSKGRPLDEKLMGRPWYSSNGGTPLNRCHYSGFTSIFTFFTTSAFGRMTSRMPFFKVACTASGLTSTGNFTVL